MRNPLLYTVLSAMKILLPMSVSAPGSPTGNHLTDVGGATGQVASFITGVADLVTHSLYFSWKLVGIVLKVATQRYRNLMETILLYLLTVCVMDRSVLFVDSH
jgi:hypothetical protein